MRLAPWPQHLFTYILTKNALENEWRARAVLPAPSRTSPPPTSAQKVHGQLANQQQSVVTPVPAVALTPPVNSAAQPPLTLAGTPSATPAVDSPAPQQTSASNQPSSPPRMSSPDMDVDVGGTPEPESMGADDMARDGESDLVVQQLERGLPRWEGLGDFGWLKEKEGSEDRRLELVLAIKGHKDAMYVHSSPPLPGRISVSPSVAIAMQLHSRPCPRKQTSLTCLSAYVVVLFRLAPCLIASVSVPSFAETDRGIEPFQSCNLPAHIRHRAVRAPMLTHPTRHLTRKLPSCLKRRVGGMNLEATRMGTSCSFKYVPLIHSHHAHVYIPF